MFSITRTSQTGQFFQSSDCFYHKQWQLFPKTFFPKQRQFSPKTQTLHKGNLLNRRVGHSYIQKKKSPIYSNVTKRQFIKQTEFGTILLFKHFCPKLGNFSPKLFFPQTTAISPQNSNITPRQFIRQTGRTFLYLYNIFSNTRM